MSRLWEDGSMIPWPNVPMRCSKRGDKHSNNGSSTRAMIGSTFPSLVLGSSGRLAPEPIDPVSAWRTVRGSGIDNGLDCICGAVLMSTVGWSSAASVGVWRHSDSAAADATPTELDGYGWHVEVIAVPGLPYDYKVAFEALKVRSDAGQAG
ncbi:hypothetical protein Micbo1qcDRAFT_180178 [Microdochium bolleyi]|uniref:Uncharacterized protein n=1 Tax=Microdochium bolleyi TaxID=196109 RepID=A0A136ING0_9PEZI|nr:hypothetical protein Micbo1qcDRAFT_180178 [Microdochium bolleyi]